MLCDMPIVIHRFLHPSIQVAVKFSLRLEDSDYSRIYYNERRHNGVFDFEEE